MSLLLHLVFVSGVVFVFFFFSLTPLLCQSAACPSVAMLVADVVDVAHASSAPVEQVEADGADRTATETQADEPAPTSAESLDSSAAAPPTPTVVASDQTPQGRSSLTHAAAAASGAMQAMHAWVMETQQSLRAVVSFPPLKSKLLQRPPFAYLHDLLRGMRRHSAIFDDAQRTGISDDMWHIDALRAKAARIEFATRIIRFTDALIRADSATAAEESLPMPQPVDLVEVRECETTAAWLRRVAALAAQELRPVPLASVPSSVAATPQLLARYRSAAPSAAASPWPAARFNALLATPAGPALPPRTPATASLPLATDTPAGRSGPGALCPPLFPLHESAVNGTMTTASGSDDAASSHQRRPSRASSEFGPVPEEPTAPIPSAAVAAAPFAGTEPVQHLATSASSSAPPAVSARIVRETRQLLGLFLPPASLTRDRLRHPSASLLLELLAHLADKTGFADGVAPRLQDLHPLADDVAAQRRVLERALRYVSLVAGSHASTLTVAQLLDGQHAEELHRLLQQLITLALDPHLRLDVVQRRFDSGVSESAVDAAAFSSPEGLRAPDIDALPAYVADTHRALQSLLSSSSSTPLLPAPLSVAELSLVTFDVFHRAVALVAAGCSFDGLVPADRTDLRMFHARTNTPAVNRAARLAFVGRIIGVVNGAVLQQSDAAPVPLDPEAVVSAGSPRGPVPTAEAAAASDYGRLVHALLQRLIEVASDPNIDRAALLHQGDASHSAHSSAANGHAHSAPLSASTAASAAAAASPPVAAANGVDSTNSPAFPLVAPRKVAPKRSCSLVALASLIVGAGAITAAYVWTVSG